VEITFLNIKIVNDYFVIGNHSMPKKLTEEYVRNYINNEKYDLLSDYKNTNTKISLKCPEGHLWKTTFKTFKNGNRCITCYRNRRRLTYSYVKKYIESFDYVLLSKTYVNTGTKLLLKCPEGHLWEIEFRRFQHGNRCMYCYQQQHKLTYEHVKEYIESFSYILLSKRYIGDKNKLKIQCPEGHIWHTSWNNFKFRDSRCPICYNESTSSKQEKMLQDYIESLGYNIIRNDRTQIFNPLTNKNLELDIWIPDLNKAIEYNGTYWHNKLDQIKKDRIKMDQCKEKGIDLLIVNEEKWQSNRELEIHRIEEWINV